MTWQEYQEAVSIFYEQAAEIGEVKRSTMLPDIDTGSQRQIDTLLTICTGGHELRILIDAKFHGRPLDVKDIEEVDALAKAVGVNKSVIVAVNGWNDFAAKKADRLGMDLRIFAIEDALECLEPDMWIMCPSCTKDCIVMNENGFADVDGAIFWWLAGRCRECGFGRTWCQDCGEKLHLKMDTEQKCHCGYIWGNDSDGIFVEA